MPNSFMMLRVLPICSASSLEKPCSELGIGTSLSQIFIMLIVNERGKSIKKIVDRNLNKLKSSKLRKKELAFASTTLAAVATGASSLMSSSNT